LPFDPLYFIQFLSLVSERKTSPIPVMACSVVVKIKGVEEGLRGVLNYRGFKPPQSLGVPLVWDQTNGA